MFSDLSGYGESMLRDGPIPRFVHGILEYALGVLFIAAPFLFNFNSGAATGMSVAVGVLILILAAASEGPVSLVNQLPLILHVALLYLLAIFLIAAPFILGFSDEVPPRNFFIISGVLLLLITIGTRFRRSEPDAATKREPARTAPAGHRAAPTDRDPNTPPQGSYPPFSNPPSSNSPSSNSPSSNPPSSGQFPPVPPPRGQPQPPGPPNPA